jgi:hypothetical protein
VDNLKSIDFLLYEIWILPTFLAYALPVPRHHRDGKFQKFSYWSNDSFLPCLVSRVDIPQAIVAKSKVKWALVACDF